MAKTALLPAHLIKIEVKGQRLLSPFEAEVEGLVVETQDDYQTADAMLARIGAAGKAWDAEMEPILKPLREAKTAADKLKAKVAKPLSELYEKVRAAMTGYKQEEARQLANARHREEQERAKLTVQIEKVATQELGARTAQMREKLVAKRVELEEKAEDIEQAPAPVTAAHSQTRMVRRWRVADFTKVCALAGGYNPDVDVSTLEYEVIPQDALMVNSVYINRLSTQPGGWAAIASWPGFEVFEDVIVAYVRGR